MLHRWLDNWAGVGLIVTGMERQGFRLHLTNAEAGVWRATFSRHPLTSAFARVETLLAGPVQEEDGLVGAARMAPVNPPMNREYLLDRLEHLEHLRRVESTLVGDASTAKRSFKDQRCHHRRVTRHGRTECSSPGDV